MTENRKLTYTKQNKEIDLLPEENQKIKTKAVITSDNKTIPIIQLKGYEKADGNLSQSLMFVISGGEKTEKKFFKQLIEPKDYPLRVLFTSKKGQGLTPKQMNTLWNDIQSTQEVAIKGQTYKLETIDKVYLITDVDHYYNELIAVTKNISNKYNNQWIISNPCFEIWIYYCNSNNPTNDLAELMNLNCDKRSQKLKQLVGVKGFKSAGAFYSIEKGIKYSLEHYKEDENNIPTLYSTQMHILAKDIIETMNKNNNEYDVFLQQKLEWKNSHLDQYQAKF